MGKATFAAGCFWGVEEAFYETSGVNASRVGYTGGTLDQPTYQQVCTGTTGHAEAVEVVFDPEKISYQALVELFFTIHDPTQRNGQGVDIGPQYRSSIFYHDEQQRQIAEQVLERIDTSGRFRSSIVTEIVPATTFWEAESYHQKYYQKNSCGCGF